MTQIHSERIRAAMCERSYTGHEIADMTSLQYRTLQHWVERGLLNPEGARRGKWQAATWHDKDLREATVLSACRRAGFSMQKMRQAAEYLRGIGHNPFSTGQFVVVKNGPGEPQELIKYCDSGEAIALLRQPGQVVMMLPEACDPG